jgi:hypothetical protein
MNGQESRVPVSRSGGSAPAVVMNVGVIFYSPILTPILAVKLRRKLEDLQHSAAVVRVLNHGGGRGPDEAALRIARDLAGWQDRAHPDGDTAIARASGILMAVGPRPEQNADPSRRAATWLVTIRQARAGHVNIVYLDETAQRNRAGKPGKAPCQQPKRAPGTRNSPPPQAAKPSSGGGKPTRASRTCRRCKQPVPASRERWGWLCEDCERRPRRVYIDPRDARIRVPPGKSVRAVSAGLPGLGKRH